MLTAFALCAGDVKEFGFREIPDDDNYHSSFSAEVPSADHAEASTGPSSKDSSTQALDETAHEEKAKAEQQNSSWFSGTSKKAASWMPWSKKEDAVRSYLEAAAACTSETDHQRFTTLSCLKTQFSPGSPALTHMSNRDCSVYQIISHV